MTLTVDPDDGGRLVETVLGHAAVLAGVAVAGVADDERGGHLEGRVRLLHDLEAAARKHDPGCLGQKRYNMF